MEDVTAAINKKSSVAGETASLIENNDLPRNELRKSAGWGCGITSAKVATTLFGISTVGVSLYHFIWDDPIIVQFFFNQTVSAVTAEFAGGLTILGLCTLGGLKCAAHYQGYDDDSEEEWTSALNRVGERQSEIPHSYEGSTFEDPQRGEGADEDQLDQQRQTDDLGASTNNMSRVSLDSEQTSTISHIVMSLDSDSKNKDNPQQQGHVTPQMQRYFDSSESLSSLSERTTSRVGLDASNLEFDLSRGVVAEGFYQSGEDVSPLILESTTDIPTTVTPTGDESDSSFSEPTASTMGKIWEESGAGLKKESDLQQDGITLYNEIPAYVDEEELDATWASMDTIRRSEKARAGIQHLTEEFGRSSTEIPLNESFPNASTDMLSGNNSNGSSKKAKDESCNTTSKSDRRKTNHRSEKARRHKDRSEKLNSSASQADESADIYNHDFGELKNTLSNSQNQKSKSRQNKSASISKASESRSKDEGVDLSESPEKKMKVHVRSRRSSSAIKRESNKPEDSGHNLNGDFKGLNHDELLSNLGKL